MTKGHGPWIIEWELSVNQWDYGVQELPIKVLKRNGSTSSQIFERKSSFGTHVPKMSADQSTLPGTATEP
jgi:hypothetical protein